MEPASLEEEYKVPDRLRGVLTLLENYLRDFMNENTTNSQEPENSMNDAKAELRMKAKYLLHWLKTREVLSSDPKLAALMKALEKELEPWDPLVSTLTQDYVQTLFVECPPTISLVHCRRLRKEAQEYAPSIDESGLPSRNDQA
jgi:hypothetical protein